jgi:hypothetical protein
MIFAPFLPDLLELFLALIVSKVFFPYLWSFGII